jgi:hypothetical protein
MCLHVQNVKCILVSEAACIGIISVLFILGVAFILLYFTRFL